ncbi:MAG: ERCC4 domain-containing protein [Bacteroidota bacterium]
MATNPSQKLNLQIDFREKNSGILEALNHYAGLFHVETCQLKTGDYLLNNQIIIERKRLPDFIDSIKTGRLFQQTYRMVHSKYHPFMILEGNKKEVRRSQMKREAIQGTLIHLTLFMGIPVIRSASIQETAQLISYTGLQLYDETSPRVHTPIFKNPRPNMNAVQKAALNVLANLPGIGPVRGISLLSSFRNLKDVFNAEPGELQSIRGIGPKLASNIYKLINEPFMKKGSSH